MSEPLHDEKDYLRAKVADLRRERDEARALPGIAVGQVWTWEPLSDSARAVLTVTEVKWNGEEWWIEAERHDDGKRYWNEAGRFIEACIYGEQPDVVRERDEAREALREAGSAIVALTQGAVNRLTADSPMLLVDVRQLDGVAERVADALKDTPT